MNRLKLLKLFLMACIVFSLLYSIFLLVSSLRTKPVQDEPEIKEVQTKEDQPQKWCNNPYKRFLKIHWPKYLINECVYHGGKITSCCHELKDDPGGFTCYGLSREYNPEFYRHIEVLIKRMNEKPTLANLSKAVHSKAALEIHKSYFMEPKINRLYYWFRQPAFDFVVNTGRYWAVRKLQKSLGLKEDGHIGPKTIEATNTAKDPEEYLKLRARFIRQTPVYKTYHRGMESRIRKNNRQTNEARLQYEKDCKM